jgi:hypothetical protein
MIFPLLQGERKTRIDNGQGWFVHKKFFMLQALLAPQVFETDRLEKYQCYWFLLHG